MSYSELSVEEASLFKSAKSKAKACVGLRA
jgi:hypothetical protein